MIRALVNHEGVLNSLNTFSDKAPFDDRRMLADLHVNMRSACVRLLQYA